MHLYIVRHGARLYGAERHHDLGLSVPGRTQAALLAEWFASRPVALTALMSSTLPRAWQTSEYVAHATGLRCEPEPLVREVGSCDPSRRPLPDDHPGPYDFEPRRRPHAPVRPGGESWADFCARISTCVTTLIARWGEGDARIALICHSGVHNAFPQVLSEPASSWVLEWFVEPTGISHYEYLGKRHGGWLLHGHNLTSHLLAGLPPTATLGD